MRSRLLTLLLAFVATLAAGGSALAASVTFTAPSDGATYPATAVLGPAGYTEASFELRTADAQPAIGFQADGGTVVCHLDSIRDSVPCGPAPAGCASCASIRPAAPLPAGQHDFDAEVDDPDGNVLAAVWLRVEIDTTPPSVELDTDGGILHADQLKPFAPRPSFAVVDDNNVGGTVDRADCSFQPHGAAPAWHACTTDSTVALAHRHRLYDVRVRATDDLGRSGAVASALYDPIPCTLTLQRHVRLGTLLARGIAVRSSCDGVTRATVAVFAYAVNGRRSASTRGAVGENPLLGKLAGKGPALGFAIHGRLRLSRAARSALAGARSVGLAFAAGPSELVTTGFATDGLSYAALAFRR